MKSEAFLAEDVWMLPDWQNAGEQHWQSLWQSKHGFCRLEQHDWQRPLRGDWSARLQETVIDAPRPVTLVAHGLGCILVAWWAAHSPLARQNVRAALLVAPADVQQSPLHHLLPGWSPVMMQALPFTSLVVGSEDDSFCSLERAEAMALAWGSQFVNAGAVGHIDADSDLGNWDAGFALLQSLEGKK